MVQIPHPGLGFIGGLHRDIAFLQMAFDAGKLFMPGLPPNVLHAVTGQAEHWASGRMIAPHDKHAEQHADESPCSNDLEYRLELLGIIHGHIPMALSM